jgi:DNA polymerase-3 subunit delta
MRLRPDQLTKHLQQPLAPVYYLSGDEPLLMQEYSDAIRQAFRDQGFSEREVLHVESGFDWQQLLGCASSMSLFGDRKLIELRLNNPKPGDAGSKALQEYTEHLNPDTALLITSAKVDASSQKTKWFKALDHCGVILQVWPLDTQQLPNWIDKRLRSKGLQADRDAIQIMVDRVEGNLLAAAQEVEKLSLLGKQQTISAETVSNVVADNSRYNIFSMVDHALAGQRKETLRALNGLRAEGGEATLILWALAKDIRLLAETQFACQQGQAAESFLRSQRVFDKRLPLMKKALQRLSEKQLTALLQLAHQTDYAIKGMNQESVWDSLTDLALGLCGVSGLSLKALAR